jgi:hypothetical protein
MNELFCPIEWPVGEYPMMPNYPYIVPNYQCVMPEQVYISEHDYTKVVDPKRNTIWLIYPYTIESSEDNYFLCLIVPYSQKNIYFLGMMNMSTNICYYLRYAIYNNSKISYDEDISCVQHQVYIYGIPTYDEYPGYIGVDKFWTDDFLRNNRYLVTKIGNYRICNSKALSPAIFDARAMSPVQYTDIPIATAVIQEEIPVATVVQLDDDTEDNKIAKLISEYKTKEELENFIMESFTDSLDDKKKLSFDISKIKSSVQWNIFFKSVILSFGREYWKVNKNLRFRVVNSNLEFFIR